MARRIPDEEPKRPPERLWKALRRIFRLGKPYTKKLATAIFLVLITSVIWLLLPLGIRTLVDAVFEDANRVLLNQITLGLLVLFVFQAFIAFAGYYLLEWTGERMVTDFRKQIYAHLHDLDLRFFSDQRTGDLTSRLTNDVGTVRTAVTTSLVEALRHSMTLVGSIGLMIMLDWQMSLIIFLVVPPVMLMARFFGMKIRKLARDVQDRLADTTAIAEEGLSAVRVVKAFAREPYEKSRYDAAVDDLFEAARKKIFISHVFWNAVGMVFLSALMGLFWYGGVSVLNGRLSTGDLVAFVFYAFNIARTVGGMSQLYSTYNSAAGASERLFELLDTTADTRDVPGATKMPELKGEVSFDAVSFGYDEEHVVLQDINITVRAGATIALVGPSGAGKTTFMNLIPRFYDVNEGKVCVDGIDVRSVTMRSLRDQIAVVSQDVQLFNATVEENIRYGNLKASKEQWEAAARAANAHQFIEELPNGYQTIVGERGAKLSGGQKQRIAIARAILRDARILLLDEATSSLDSTSEALVQDALDRLMQGRTTFIIAHRLSTVQHADRILVIDRGKIVQQGTHDELFNEKGLYRDLATLQFQEAVTAP